MSMVPEATFSQWDILEMVKSELRDSDGFDEVERIAAALGAVIGECVGRPASILALRRVMDANMEIYAIMKGEARTEIKWH